MIRDSLKVLFPGAALLLCLAGCEGAPPPSALPAVAPPTRAPNRVIVPEPRLALSDDAASKGIYAIVYGTTYAGSFSTPVHADINEEYVYVFEGERGDVIDVVFEHDKLDGIKGEFDILDLTTDRSYSGESSFFPLFNLQNRLVKEEFSLPSTGRYAIGIRVYGRHRAFASSIAFSLTLDGHSARDRALLRELDGYHLVYERFQAELGAREALEASFFVTLQPGKAPEELMQAGINFGKNSGKYCPTWAPDGRGVIYAEFTSGGRQSSILTASLAGGRERTLATGLRGDIGAPRYSPDGQKIAFHMQGREPDTYEVMVLDVASGEHHQVTYIGHKSRYPAWSPDGERLYFHSDRQGNFDLYSISVEGADLRQLTTSLADEYRADASPDGQQVVYTRALSDGNSEIYLMATDGSNQRPFTALGALAHSPQWTPDGQWILFSSTHNTGNLSNLFLAAADGSRYVHVAEAWYDNECPAISPRME